MRFCQKIDLINHALDISIIKLNENVMQVVHTSTVHGTNDMGIISREYRGDIAGKPINNLLISGMMAESASNNHVQPGQSSRADILTVNIIQPPMMTSNLDQRGSSPIDLFDKPPPPLTPTTV
jgi:hypothetical protein